MAAVNGGSGADHAGARIESTISMLAQGKNAITFVVRSYYLVSIADL